MTKQKTNPNGELIHSIRGVSFPDLDEKYQDAGQLYKEICGIGGHGNFQAHNRPDLTFDGLDPVIFARIEKTIKNWKKKK